MLTSFLIRVMMRSTLIMTGGNAMQKLKAFREAAGVSQYNMARKMDISMSFYEKVERGHTNASRGFMQKLKRAFPEANIDEIFFSNMEAEVV